MSATKDPRQKTGYQLRRSIVLAVRDAVQDGAAESQNAFVERALIRELQELRKEKLAAAYEEAARDPVFMQEMRDLDAAWDVTSCDGIGASD
jgi:hypothetical protein